MIGLAASAVATLLAMPADAAADCKRTKSGAHCLITYLASPGAPQELHFTIRNNSGDPDSRNAVRTNVGWLDIDNNRDHRHWHGPAGKAGQRYWRGFAKYWRACTNTWIEDQFVCTPWAYRGPPPLGTPFGLPPLGLP